MKKNIIYNEIEYSNYQIDENGVITNISTGGVLSHTVRDNGLSFSTIKHDGKSKQIFIRKCLRETFGFNPDTMIDKIESDEEWKNVLINNEESQYYISNYGRVFAVNQDKIKQYNLNNTKKYCRYNLYVGTINGKEKQEWTTAHQLVAIYFLENDNPEVKTQVNHIDGNKLNNHVSNLEWISNPDNQRHAIEEGLRHGITFEIGKKILEDYNNGELIIRISEKYNFNRNTISKYIKKHTLNDM